jgi:hypothetical protein
MRGRYSSIFTGAVLKEISDVRAIIFAVSDDTILPPRVSLHFAILIRRMISLISLSE